MFFNYDEGSQDREEELEESKTKIESHLNKNRYGLVSSWKVPQKWRDIGKQNAQNEVGIWKFSGTSIDSEGSFVTIDSIHDKKEKDEKEEGDDVSREKCYFEYQEQLKRVLRLVFIRIVYFHSFYAVYICPFLPYHRQQII